MRLIVGISGADGVILGYRLLQALRKIPDMEIHLVVTEGAAKNFEYETDLSLDQVARLADVVHDNRNMAASISSGSFETDGMIVIPCSMKTLSGIVNGFAGNLLLRAADGCLKEGRKVVLVPREMPLGRIHLKNLKEALREDDIKSSDVNYIKSEVIEINIKNKCVKPINRAIHALIEALVNYSRINIVDEDTREYFLERFLESERIIKRVGNEEEKDKDLKFRKFNPPFTIAIFASFTLKPPLRIIFT